MGQQVVKIQIHNLFVDAAWVRIDEELRRRGKNWQWLADKMEWSIQRMHNWKARGVPAKAFPELATALGRSIDWIASRTDDEPLTSYRAADEPRSRNDNWPFHRISLARVLRLAPADLSRIETYIEATVHTSEANADDRKRSRG